MATADTDSSPVPVYDSSSLVSVKEFDILTYDVLKQHLPHAARDSLSAVRQQRDIRESEEPLKHFRLSHSSRIPSCVLTILFTGCIKIIAIEN